MEMTLLGTAAAEGWPGLFCKCNVCMETRRLRGRNLRTRSSAMIDNVLKIDLPPDTLHHVMQYNLDLTQLRAVLFTHAHDDHLCATELQYIGPWFVTTPRSDKLHVYGPPEVKKRLQCELNLEQVPIEIQVLTPFETVDVANYLVTPIIARHDPSQICYNYILQSPDGSQILYASDTGYYEEETWNFMEGVHFDAVIAECTNGPTSSDYSGHMGVTELLQMRRRLIDTGSISPECLFVATHFSHQGGENHSGLEAIFTPESVVTAYDGITFAIPNRSKASSSLQYA